MNLNDISFDCESLGVDTDAPIISIGAVAFDRTTGKLGQTFYKEIGIDSAIKAGRVRADTLRWWINQSPQARVLLSKPDSEKPSLATVLLEFTTWARGVGKGVPRVWAKGPAEDVAWLRTALRNGSHGLAEPWGYNNVRDVRTIIEVDTPNAGDHIIDSLTYAFCVNVANSGKFSEVDCKCVHFSLPMDHITSTRYGMM